MFKKVYKVLAAGQSYDENGNPIVSLLDTFDTLEESQEYLATNEQLSIIIQHRILLTMFISW